MPIVRCLRHFVMDFAACDDRVKVSISRASIRVQPECKQVSDTEQCNYANNEQDGLPFCRRVEPPVSSFGEAKRFTARIDDRVADESHGSPKCGSESFGLKRERGLREAVIVARLNVADLRLSLLQLCLAQFNDRAQTHFVACLRKCESKVCLLK